MFFSPKSVKTIMHATPLNTFRWGHVLPGALNLLGRGFSRKLLSLVQTPSSLLELHVVLFHRHLLDLLIPPDAIVEHHIKQLKTTYIYINQFVYFFFSRARLFRHTFIEWRALLDLPFAVCSL